MSALRAAIMCADARATARSFDRLRTCPGQPISHRPPRELYTAHGRRLLALGDTQDLLVAPINQLHAVPDIALLLAALGLLAVDDDPRGQAVVVGGGTAWIPREARPRGQLSRAGRAGLARGKGPAVCGVVLADGVGAVEEGGECAIFSVDVAQPTTMFGIQIGVTVRII